MPKHKNSVIARSSESESRHLLVTNSMTASAQNLIGSCETAIEAQGTSYAAKAGNGTQRSLQAVCSTNGLSALVKYGNTVIRVEGDSFAISTHE